ncbi:hypothetical protein CPAST_c02670 [Clostridium pasteurianum DSM 525 = ATCC 6013]|uniref:Transmembrane protein n=1 Tax=Clostridium pasteurianum DSM 525 = ATCC 6013 TaxID=1262449 RepID=A0A0H3J102_CLOPA|nr:hypothetical protein [Clostridium pasteurianum]AJA46367.1 hypothetical protein CPAST_c02670 [Clostridium pasteurianum DSM 525 = ATCC 6013]AJA50355.1 hypothetical protein CLPA_c02670 [Clostridium pasteurianum DSM 525 = ATCC 6013]AOZ73804.1 hypothetical protein AQ983_01285 [Clostridium pasteurianum DSM 525 = ATCC 6013]AOZ77601.1 hypothetical protein AQ984_01285 [Clostridium pasteurianum]ELP60942.1 membrane protein [Clostridium pasteurianum DSM 525 = ATCC 6013]
MSIDKAIKKQRASYRRSMIAMSFILVFLPLVWYLSEQINIFFFVYLSLIEIFILTAMIFKTKIQVLTYEIDRYKIKISIGFPKKDIKLLCEKVDIIHAEGSEKDMRVVLITKATTRSRFIRKVDANFLKRYPYAGYHYGRFKKNNPESNYFYTVISTGGYKKYKLLNELYKSCTSAFFTEEAILQIKEYRNRQ